MNIRTDNATVGHVLIDFVDSYSYSQVSFDSYGYLAGSAAAGLMLLRLRFRLRYHDRNNSTLANSSPAAQAASISTPSAALEAGFAFGSGFSGRSDMRALLSRRLLGAPAAPAELSLLAAV